MSDLRFSILDLRLPIIQRRFAMKGRNRKSQIANPKSKIVDVDVLHVSNSPLNELGQHMHFADHAKGETHAGHGTVEGLWHYYMLTGEPRAGEVARGIADYFARIAAWKDFLDHRDAETRRRGDCLIKLRDL